MRKTINWLLLWCGLLLVSSGLAWRWAKQTAVVPLNAQEEFVYFFPSFFHSGRNYTDIALPSPEQPTPTATTSPTPAVTTTPPTAEPVPTKRPFPRHGVAVANWETAVEQSKRLGDWSHQWYAYNGDYPTDHEIVPMLVFSTGLPDPAVIAEIDRKTDEATGHDYWLVFNECEAWQQCNKPPEAQAALYGQRILPAVAAGDPNAKLLVGGSIADTRGLTWMTAFVEAYREQFGTEPPRAGWHFHIYPEVESQPTIKNFIRDAERFKHWLLRYGSPEDEVWLTEIGCLATEICRESEAYMLEILDYLNSEEGAWITRYAWFTTYTTPECRPCGNSPGTHLLERRPPHQLTALGEAYAAYFATSTPTPTPAGTQTAVPLIPPTATPTPMTAYP